MLSQSRPKVYNITNTSFKCNKNQKHDGLRHYSVQGGGSLQEGRQKMVKMAENRDFTIEWFPVS